MGKRKQCPISQKRIYVSVANKSPLLRMKNIQGKIPPRRGPAQRAGER